MMNPFEGMYLRPGNLWKTFQIERTVVDTPGTRPITMKRLAGEVDGILAEADSYQNDKVKHRWDQDQHSLSHTLVIRGTIGLKKGDIIRDESRYFVVLATDDASYLGGTTLVYLEERKDLK